MTPDNRAAVMRALESWNAGDSDGYLAMYDGAVRMHGYSPEPMDHAEMVAFYTGIWEAFPEPKLIFDDVLPVDDKVVIRFTMSGRHEGTFMGVPPTGAPISVSGITILRFAGGRCVERWSSADMLGLLVQIGAVPAPA